jgi:hypothetical protein
MVCKKNTGDLYWSRPKNALRPVREESSALSCTKVLVVGVTSECERGRGSQVSRCEWSARMCVALLEPLQGPGESSDRVMPSFFRTVPACSFYSLKEVQGYMMSVCGRSLPRKQP